MLSSFIDWFLSWFNGDWRMSFKPLDQSHLEQLCIWFKKPHVKEWWNDGISNEEIKAKYRERIGGTDILPFVVYLRRKPIGFIQYYYMNRIEFDELSNEIGVVVGIDQFIGEEDYINQGYGTRMIGLLIKKLFSDPAIKKIITDVDKNNRRAIRCYEKLGFTFSRKVTTPEGQKIILEKDR
jgi:RimJ/RimL family protein N-acetyltransferase